MSVPYDHADQSSTDFPPAEFPAVPVGARTPSWVIGVSVFAATMMTLSGIMHIMEGITALFQNEIFAVRPYYAFALDPTAWGWFHILLGVLLIIAGVCIPAGQLWARWIGIGFAGLSLAASFAFIPYYPLWAVLVAVLSFFAIVALCAFRGPVVG